jgi:hypothetical protein
MYIELNTLTLKNFKGIKDLTVNFTKNTDIKGANGLCKSTINDGFRWLLFNKNSADEANFSIKTNTPDGLPIHYLDHEVEGTLNVDGTPAVFKKKLNEDWVKPKGKTVPVMKGHTTTYYFNDVPVTQREYMEKIDAICPETRFKLLTDPTYFFSLHWTKQREIISGLCSVTDAEIAQGKPLFTSLLDYLQSKNVKLEQYKKELAVKRLKIIEDAEKLPTRIDEVFKGMPEAKDWAMLEAEILKGDAEIKLIDGLITGKTTAQSGVFAANQLIQDKKNDRITSRDAIAFEIKTAANKVVNDAKDALETIKFNISTANTDKNRQLTLISIAEKDITTHQATLVTLREQWYKIDGESLVFGEYDCKCPTCAREYDIEKSEAIQAAMTATFNESKATRKKINEISGTEIVDKVKRLEIGIKAHQESIAFLDTKILYMKAEQITAEEAIPAGQVDIKKLLEDSAEYQAVLKEIDAIVVPEAPVVDTVELEHRKSLYQTGVDNAKKLLGDREAIEKANARIEELKAEQLVLAQKQADIEAGEFVIADFEKTKIEAIEAAVNSMFKVVKFKMFEQQINGGETPTCVGTVNGVPFPDLNTAMKINAGMDIINTLSEANNVFAPIFIDGRESINQLAECQSQIINLIVTKDKTLIVN